MDGAAKEVEGREDQPDTAKAVTNRSNQTEADGCTIAQDHDDPSDKGKESRIEANRNEASGTKEKINLERVAIKAEGRTDQSDIAKAVTNRSNRPEVESSKDRGRQEDYFAPCYHPEAASSDGKEEGGTKWARVKSWWSLRLQMKKGQARQQSR